MVPVEGTEKELKADLVLIAAGFLGSESYVTDQFKVERNQRTNVATAEDMHKTSRENIFTAGDMHRGQSLVVWAIAEGRAAAREVGYPVILRAAYALGGLGSGFCENEEVQSGIRPCICVSNDINNTWSNNVQFIPLTTQHKNNLPTHYTLKKQNYSFLKEDSIVLAEQLNICSIENVVRFLGRVNSEDINNIKECIKLQFDL